jgi:hypothetical protein
MPAKEQKQTKSIPYTSIFIAIFVIALAILFGPLFLRPIASIKGATPKLVRTAHTATTTSTMATTKYSPAEERQWNA